VTTQKENICKEALGGMPSEAHTPESRCSLEPLNTTTITAKILILRVLGKNTPSTAKRLIQTQIKPIKQSLLLEGLPTAVRSQTLALWHIPPAEGAASPVLSPCQMPGCWRAALLRPFDYLGSLLG